MDEPKEPLVKKEPVMIVTLVEAVTSIGAILGLDLSLNVKLCIAGVLILGAGLLKRHLVYSPATVAKMQGKTP